jgi:DNA (cytosine-5)-methyltransferase 1
MIYYNDFDQKSIAWLNELIKEGLIPKGRVDGRPIQEVNNYELFGYTTAHFFAGIGGWAHALQLAGWPQGLPVWTGSCPCQPFSAAGRRKGIEDERHLWPFFRELIAKCAPPVIFGEQVASKLGREWLAGVRADLETLGYAVGAADLCAAGVGAPHIRQRLFWVAVAKGIGLQESREKQGYSSEAPSGDDGMGNASRSGLHRDNRREPGQEPKNRHSWSDSLFIYCRDKKYRRVPLEPSLFPLAPRIQGRVGLLRGAGNAIVPQVAAEFIKAVNEVLHLY